MADSIPPTSVDELRTTLNDPTWSVQLCVCSETDRVWQLAVSLEGTFARHAVYRTDSHADVAEWLPPPTAGGDPSHPIVAIFGFGPAVFERIDSTRATQRAVVRETIRRARQQ